jgi:hypothetical protein
MAGARFMTLPLPPPLAPWSPHLALFPIDLALELGAIVRRLDSALGPPITTRHRGDDPDGFDGIVHNGPYDRMLHSEWLLADEMPDEFLRRAVMREQLFFRIAHRSPLDELMSVALYDAGPTQIGAPRTLHIALLIVLARRCAERNGRLRWAVLQETPRRLYDHVDADAVLDLLRLHTAREVSEEDLDAWNDLLPHGDRRHRETWMIGGERLGRLVDTHAHLREVSQVEIREAIDVKSRDIDVRVRDARGGRRSLTLRLPAEREVIRLLRNPFDPLPHAPADVRAVEPSGAMFFAADGKRVIARAPNGGIYVHVIRQEECVSTKEYQARAGEPVIAAGWGKRQGGTSIAVVDWRRTRLRVGTLHRQQPGAIVETNGTFAWHMSDLLSPIAWTHASDELFIDCNNVCWMTATGKGLVLRVTDRVFALTTYNGLAHLAKHDGGWKIIRVEKDALTVAASFEGNGTHAFFGTGSPDSGESGLFALEQSPGLWLAAGETLRNYACPPNARVIGVTALRWTKGPALVVAEENAISVLAGTSIKQVCQTVRPITVAACDTSGPRAAYVTDRRLRVVALEPKGTRR